MSNKRKGKEKLPLILSTIISVMSCFVGGVSTFAWFQSYGEAVVKSTSGTTQIRVDMPEQFKLGPATLYAYAGNGVAGYSGDLADDLSVDDAEDFIKLDTAELRTQYLSISGLVPGHKMSFCIKISATNDHEITQASLSLTKYTAVNNNYRKVLSSVVDGGAGEVGKYPNSQDDRIIRIEDIVKFHGTVNTTGIFELGSASVLTDYDKTYTSGDGPRSTQYTSQAYEISDGDALAGNTIYLFYTLEFANDSSTWFREYTETSSVYHKCYEVIANDYDGERYFAQDPEKGSSTCYEGLSFQIDELEVFAV